MSPLRLLAAILVLSLASTALTAQLRVAGLEVVDAYDRPEGYLVFAPDDAATRADSLGLVVFLHGYGALNPLNYGAWLRHIVNSGNVVVYPRYQRSLFSPRSHKFAGTASAGIRAALARVAEMQWAVDHTTYSLVGHSYGGTLAALFAAAPGDYDLPAPHGAVLIAPGTNKLRGARLESYQHIPAAMPLAVVTHEDDYVTGTEFVELMEATCADAETFRWWHQTSNPEVPVGLSAHHNECYALDSTFDTGLRNYTTKKAMRVGTLDAVDTALIWAITDQLLDAAKSGIRPAWSRPDAQLRYPDSSADTDGEVLFEARARGRWWANRLPAEASEGDAGDARRVAAPAEHRDKL